MRKLTILAIAALLATGLMANKCDFSFGDKNMPNSGEETTDTGSE